MALLLVGEVVKRITASSFASNIDMDVLGILNLDGVFHRKKFVCRELAFANFRGSEHFNVKFHPQFEWDIITEQERQHLFFVSRCITGLPIRASSSECALPQDALEQTLKKIYNQLVPIYGCLIVAYRGGHIERDLLSKLGIPSIDLTDYQCPKFDELIKDHEQLKNYACGHHVKSKDSYHCASVKVELFKLWLMKNTV